MGILFLADLSEADHNVLRNIIHNYPTESYDKWLDLQTKRRTQWEADGDKVVFVKVSADDFIRYCRLNGARSDISTLIAVANAKGTGKFK